MANRDYNIVSDLLAAFGSGSASGSASASGGGDIESRWLGWTKNGYGQTNGRAYDVSFNAAASSGAGAGGAGNYVSQLEQQILRSDLPVEVNETEELTVLGHRGVWVNKQEVQAWRGDVDISEYKIYEDRNPQVINKRVNQAVEYVQELAIRYLRPPSPAAGGDIVINQEPNFQTAPAPPLIIRQAAARASTPEPLVIREAPPKPPAPVGPKRITISGKRHPPPPRKVVIERLAALPPKPQNVIIERWLPYANKAKRRVVFNKAPEVQADKADSHNVIVQWEAPQVNLRKEVKYLGVIKANPEEYVQRYRGSLKVHTDLPQFVLDIQTPSELGALAANAKYESSYELEGAIEALQYVDLEANGLGEYRQFLLNAGFKLFGSSAASASTSGNIASTAAQIFAILDADNSGEISISEAEKMVLKLNSKLGRSYGEAEVHEFFTAAAQGDDLITLPEFVQVFEQMANL